MAERKPIGKKLRFEVFKRDKFTCQYCGRMSPDVILEVDHIKPVAKGGTNDILNLVTSCKDCNRGKGKTKLSENDTLKRQQKQLKEMAEKNEQLKMMVDWKNEMLALKEQQIDSIDDLVRATTDYELTDKGKRIIAKYLSQFPYSLVYEATEISMNHYYRDDVSEYLRSQSFENALKKIGGICYNKTKVG